MQTTQIEKINDFVASLSELQSVTGAVAYGIDSNGNSVKISLSQFGQQSDVETLQTDVSNLQSSVEALGTGKADETTSFEEAQTRTNINSGDTVTTIWGKIKKFFSDLAAVAFSGSYTDLTDTPSLATVATSGSYADLSDTPTLADVATSGSYNDLSDTPNLATVATSGKYTDLSNKPTKDFTLTAPSTTVSAGTCMGLIKWSRTDINERVEILGGWTTGTLGMITIEVKGRPVASMGYSLSYSKPAIDKSYTIACGIKNDEVYLYFKYTQSNYKSGASIRLSGFRNDYAESLNFQILDESQFTNIESIQIS